jgi:hypothetical protein
MPNIYNSTKGIFKNEKLLNDMEFDTHFYHKYLSKSSAIERSN